MMRAVKRFLQLKPLPAILAIVAVLLASPAIGTGWQQDDLVHRYFLLGNQDYSGKVPSPLDVFRFMDGDPRRTTRLRTPGGAGVSLLAIRLCIPPCRARGH